MAYKFALIDPVTGLISSVITSFDVNFTDGAIINNTLYKNIDNSSITEENFTTLRYDLSTNSFISLPVKPTDYHIWDSISLSWVVTPAILQDLKAKKQAEIDSKRLYLGKSVIQYSNKLLDADTQAQANINGKLQEIFAREAINSPLTSGEMFWKDANNVVHSWTNQNDYKLWLQGLVIAISSRNTSLYATAWTKKAEVEAEALTDINDIINYDVNTGW